MPFCQCPKCKAVFTVTVPDTAAWYAEKWPGYSTSEPVPEVCPACAERALDRMTDFGRGAASQMFGKGK